MPDLLDQWLFEGEGDQLEFKQTINEPFKIAKTICALANSKGGNILVGVRDDKTLVGIDPDEEKHLIEQAAFFCCHPPVKIHLTEHLINQDQADEIIILQVYIAESEEKPHFVIDKNGNRQAYIRENDKTMHLGKKMLRQLDILPKPGKVALSANEKRAMDYLKVHKRMLMKDYMKLVNISKRRASRELNIMIHKKLVKVMEHEKADYYILF